MGKRVYATIGKKRNVIKVQTYTYDKEKGESWESTMYIAFEKIYIDNKMVSIVSVCDKQYTYTLDEYELIKVFDLEYPLLSATLGSE